MVAARQHVTPEFFSERMITRFWDRVDIRGPNECWPWKAGCNLHGYGMFYGGQDRTIASRYVLHLMSERNLTEYEWACHSCDNPPCCNPAHIWSGTPRDNALDMVSKGRGSVILPSHCIRGHAYEGDNIAFLKRGGRACRACIRLRARERRLANFKPPHRADGTGPTNPTPSNVGPHTSKGAK